MFVLGLTGSIGTGKSTAVAMLRRLGLAVHDADAAVHRLTGPGGRAVPAIADLFPEAVPDGRVDRVRLGRRVFDDLQALASLEAVLHPMVRDMEGRFLRAAARRGAARVVLDIPLLFETRAERRCDAVCVMTCPPRIQKRRVLARPGMTPDKLRAILARQMVPAEKARRADFVVPSGLGKNLTWRCLQDVVGSVTRTDGRVWAPSPNWRPQGQA